MQQPDGYGNQNHPIRLSHISAKETVGALTGFKGPNGRFHVIEGLNTIYVTDTQANINHMLEIIKKIDVPSPVREEMFVRQIKHASATGVKTHLEAGAKNRTVHGMVQIVADDRSNQLIIITQKENMAFIDKMIATVDVSTEPEIGVESIRLKYADAEDATQMLRNLFGACSSSFQARSNKNMKENRHPICQRDLPLQRNANKVPDNDNPEAESTGDVKVYANRRDDSLVVMAPKASMDAIKRAIDKMDVKPAQVQLETVIVEVELDDDIQTGTDWIERGRQKFFDGDRLNIAAILQAAKGDSRTKILYTPTLSTLDNKLAEIAATESIYLLGNRHSFTPINSRGLLRNHEERDINIFMRDIGLTMKVLPRVDPNGTVTLILEGSFKARGTDQNIPNESGGTDPYATISECRRSCKMMAEGNQTIMMGGLTKKTNVQSESGVPVLKDIPWIGKPLFGSTSTKEVRSELLVFITPHVLDGENKVSH